MSDLIQNPFLTELIEKGHNFQSVAPVSVKHNMKHNWQWSAAFSFYKKLTAIINELINLKESYSPLPVWQ